jgi:hypothetical protein
MANPTTNYGFVLPTSTDLVTDLPADFDVALQGVDTRLKALQPGTTLGDLAYSSATANTNTRLGIGTTGQVLSVSGGVPAWSTPSSGSLTSLATGSLSGSALTISSISGSYKNLVLQLENVYFSSATQRVRLTVNSTANIYQEVGSGYSYADPSAAYYEVLFGTNSNTNTFSNFIIYGYSGTTKKISSNYLYGRAASGGSPIDVTGSSACAINTTSAISSITLTASAGTFSGGTYTVFGVN